MGRVESKPHSEKTMSDQKRYTYKDFATGKQRWTKGQFAGWTEGGPLGARYAIFQRLASSVLVPEYCLTQETRKELSHD
jgi:hypothetical protein